MSKLQFLIKKRYKKMFSCTRLFFFFFNFWSSKPRSGLDPHPDPDSLEMLDSDPDSMFPDPPLLVPI